MAAAPLSESEPKLRCWRCREATPLTFFCQNCEAVQRLPSDSNYSMLLGFGGLPRIDQSALKDRYYALSRQLHPDRFQTGSTEEQTASLQSAALLNTAFKTLSDVEARGRWWLEREGETLGRGNNEVPPALAARVFEVQEMIAEFEASRQEGNSGMRGDLESVAAEIRDELEEEKTTVEKILQDWEETLADPAPARRALKEGLSRVAYLRTLARDLNRALED